MKTIVFSKPVRLIIIPLVLILALFAFYPRVFLNFSASIPFADQGDTQNILGIIDYCVHAPLSPRGFYNLPFLYPHANLLTRTHPLIGESIVFRLFHRVGFDLEQSNNLYILLAFFLGALGCFLLTREITQHNGLSLLTAILYYVLPQQVVHLHWLNFLSGFYLPFIILFLLRYFSRKKSRYLIALGICVVMQVLSSLYYGAHLFLIILPTLALSAVIIKSVPWKKLIPLGMTYLAAGGVLLLFLFPFVTQKQLGSDFRVNARHMVHVTNLFSCGTFSNLLHAGKINREELLELSPSFFPGFSFAALFLFFFISPVRKRRWHVFAGLFSLVFTLSFLCLNRYYLAAEIVFIVFAAILVFLFVLYRRHFSPNEQLLFIVFAVFTAVFMSFPRICLLNKAVPYNLFCGLFPLHGLRALTRVYPYVFPILIPLVAAGINAVLKTCGSSGGRGMAKIIAGLLMVLAFIEGYPYRMLNPDNFGSLHMASRQAEFSRYGIPRHGIILEIPFYSGIAVTRNSDYMLNWSAHRCCMVNGKVSRQGDIFGKAMFKALNPCFLTSFIREKTLKCLLAHFSVSHVVIHWNKLTKISREVLYQRRSQVEQIKKYGKVVYTDGNTTVLRVKEFVPVKTVARCYAAYHLRRGRVELRLHEKYDGFIWIAFNNRFLRRKRVASDTMVLDFSAQPLDDSGNRIRIHFGSPVRLESCRILFPRHQRNSESGKKSGRDPHNERMKDRGNRQTGTRIPGSV